VYSIAITLKEVLGDRTKEISATILGTDIDEDATPERAERIFDRKKQMKNVKPETP